MRGSDAVYRFGGEEFSVFLPDATALQGKEVAERIREAFEQVSVEIVDEERVSHSLKGTVSIGCTGTDQLEDWDKVDKDELDGFLGKLLSRADAALYRSKGSGRNRVTIFHEDADISKND